METCVPCIYSFHKIAGVSNLCCDSGLGKNVYT